MTARILLRRLSFLGIAVTAGVSTSGCFEPLVVNPNDAGVAAGTGGSGAVLPALLIDDFEDGNRVPSDLQFGPWRCATWGASPSPKCGSSTPGYLTEHGFYVDFVLTDAPNGKLDYPGVSLTTLTVSEFDASPYHSLVFSVSLAPHAQPLVQPVIVLVELRCGGISDKVAAASDILAIGLGAELKEPTGDWHTFSLDLSRFVQFAWAKEQLAIDRNLCIQRVDGIEFTYQLAYAVGDASVDGESVAATMTIDKVYFQ